MHSNHIEKKRWLQEIITEIISPTKYTTDYKTSRFIKRILLTAVVSVSKTMLGTSRYLLIFSK